MPFLACCDRAVGGGDARQMVGRRPGGSLSRTFIAFVVQFPGTIAVLCLGFAFRYLGVHYFNKTKACVLCIYGLVFIFSFLLFALSY